MEEAIWACFFVFEPWEAVIKLDWDVLLSEEEFGMDIVDFEGTGGGNALKSGSKGTG